MNPNTFGDGRKFFQYLYADIKICRKSDKDYIISFKKIKNFVSIQSYNFIFPEENKSREVYKQNVKQFIEIFNSIPSYMPTGVMDTCGMPFPFVLKSVFCNKNMIWNISTQDIKIADKSACKSFKPGFYENVRISIDPNNPITWDYSSNLITFTPTYPPNLPKRCKNKFQVAYQLKGGLLQYLLNSTKTEAEGSKIIIDNTIEVKLAQPPHGTPAGTGKFGFKGLIELIKENYKNKNENIIFGGFPECSYDCKGSPSVCKFLPQNVSTLSYDVFSKYFT